MKTIFKRRSLFFFDAAIFLIVGIVVMFIPSPSLSLQNPLPPGALPVVEDTRRLLAALYIALGLCLYIFGSNVVNAATQNLAAKLRGLSLFVLVGVNILQITNGNWIPTSLAVYICLFSLMGLTYLYFGFVKPKADSSTRAVLDEPK